MDSPPTKSAMFGLFTKTTLTLPQRSALLLTLLQAVLMAHVKHGKPLPENLMATVLDNWLKRNGGKVSRRFKAGVSEAGYDMARHLRASLSAQAIQELWEFLDKAQHNRPGQNPEADSYLFSLMDECRDTILLRELTDR